MTHRGIQAISRVAVLGGAENLRRSAAWIVLASWTLVGCQQPIRDRPIGAFPSPWTDGSIRPPSPGDPLECRALQDPLAFLQMCIQRYDEWVRDYRCWFHIRERTPGAAELGDEQLIDIRFRQEPYSVDMRWLKNPVHATRVNYVAGRWNTDGRERAWIFPSGLLAVLTPAGVRLDIHNPQVRAASRRPVNDFGFKRTLEVIVDYCKAAANDPAFSLRFAGSTDFDNRDCLVFERRLPYRDAGGSYPDRLLVIYIDREWLVPLACFSYADDQATQPLGSYVTTAILFNVGLTDADF